MASIRIFGQPCRKNIGNLLNGPRNSAVFVAFSPVLSSQQCQRANLWSWSGPASRDSNVLPLKVTRRNKLFKATGLRLKSTVEPPKKDDATLKTKLKEAVTQSLKATKHENIYTIPNILTATRLVAAPIVGYLVLHDHHAWALGLFAYAGITDLVDGWIARKWNLQTVVGTIIDPAADKMLMTILTVTLAMKGLLPLWLAVIILGRDVGLMISAFYYRWISLPPPKTMARYWDFSLPSAEVKPTTISKVNTALQLGLIGGTLALPVLPFELGTAMMAFQALVGTTTVWSGLSYVFSKDAVKILYKKDGSVDESVAENKDKDEKKP